MSSKKASELGMNNKLPAEIKKINSSHINNKKNMTSSRSIPKIKMMSSSSSG